MGGDPGPPTARYAHAIAVSEATTIDRVPGCDGLVLDLAALWAAVDALDEHEGS